MRRWAPAHRPVHPHYCTARFGVRAWQAAGVSVELAYTRSAPLACSSFQGADKLKGLGATDVVVGDVLLGGTGLLERAAEGCDALVIATSAVPQLKPLSLIKV